MDNSIKIRTHRWLRMNIEIKPGLTLVFFFLPLHTRTHAYTRTCTAKHVFSRVLITCQLQINEHSQLVGLLRVQSAYQLRREERRKKDEANLLLRMRLSAVNQQIQESAHLLWLCNVAGSKMGKSILGLD